MCNVHFDSGEFYFPSSSGSSVLCDYRATRVYWRRVGVWLISITQVRAGNQPFLAGLCVAHSCPPFPRPYIFLFYFFSLEEKEEKKRKRITKVLKHSAVSTLRWLFFFFFMCFLSCLTSVARFSCYWRTGGCWTSADFVCMAECDRYSFVTWQFVIFRWDSTLTCHKLIILLIVFTSSFVIK